MPPRGWMIGSSIGLPLSVSLTNQPDEMRTFDSLRFSIGQFTILLIPNSSSNEGVDRGQHYRASMPAPRTR